MIPTEKADAVRRVIFEVKDIFRSTTTEIKGTKWMQKGGHFVYKFEVTAIGLYQK